MRTALMLAVLTLLATPAFADVVTINGVDYPAVKGSVITLNNRDARTGVCPQPDVMLTGTKTIMVTISADGCSVTVKKATSKGPTSSNGWTVPEATERHW